MRPIAPKHITHTGHGNLSEAVTPKRVALFVLSLLAGAALSVVGIYGISALVMLSNVSRLSMPARTWPIRRWAAAGTRTSRRRPRNWCRPRAGCATN